MSAKGFVEQQIDRMHESGELRPPVIFRRLLEIFIEETRKAREEEKKDEIKKSAASLEQEQKVLAACRGCITALTPKSPTLGQGPAVSGPQAGRAHAERKAEISSDHFKNALGQFSQQLQAAGFNQDSPLLPYLSGFLNVYDFADCFPELGLESGRLQAFNAQAEKFLVALSQQALTRLKPRGATGVSHEIKAVPGEILPYYLCNFIEQNFNHLTVKIQEDTVITFLLACLRDRDFYVISAAIEAFKVTLPRLEEKVKPTVVDALISALDTLLMADARLENDIRSAAEIIAPHFAAASPETRDKLLKRLLLNRGHLHSKHIDIDHLLKLFMPLFSRGEISHALDLLLANLDENLKRGWGFSVSDNLRGLADLAPYLEADEIAHVLPYFSRYLSDHRHDTYFFFGKASIRIALGTFVQRLEGETRKHVLSTLLTLHKNDQAALIPYLEGEERQQALVALLERLRDPAFFNDDDVVRMVADHMPNLRENEKEQALHALLESLAHDNEAPDDRRERLCSTVWRLIRTVVQVKNERTQCLQPLLVRAMPSSEPNWKVRNMAWNALHTLFQDLETKEHELILDPLLSRLEQANNEFEWSGQKRDACKMACKLIPTLLGDVRARALNGVLRHTADYLICRDIIPLIADLSMPERALVLARMLQQLDPPSDLDTKLASLTVLVAFAPHLETDERKNVLARMLTELALSSGENDTDTTIRDSVYPVLAALYPGAEKAEQTQILSVLHSGIGKTEESLVLGRLCSLIPHQETGDARTQLFAFLLGRVGSPTAEMRRVACQTLARLVPELHPQERNMAIAGLIRGLGDSDEWVRNAAHHFFQKYEKQLDLRGREALFTEISTAFDQAKQDNVKAMLFSHLLALGPQTHASAIEDQVREVLDAPTANHVLGYLGLRGSR